MVEEGEKSIKCFKTMYAETSAAIRHYSGLRFIVFTAWLLIQGAFSSAALTILNNDSLNKSVVIVLGFTAIFVTLGAYFIEMRIDCHLKHFKDALREMEEGKSPLVWRKLPAPPCVWHKFPEFRISTHNTIVLMYSSFALVFVTMYFLF